MKFLKHILLFFCFLHVSQTLTGQEDTAQTQMKFDFGITRDKNINLWPLFKYFRDKNEVDLQVLYPVFRKQYDTLTQTNRSHLFPLYWNYKDTKIQDKRFLSLYYPSLVRTVKDSSRTVNSFRFLELAPEVNMLEFTKSDDGLFVQNNLLFFIWSKNDRINHRSHFITFPLYWHFKSLESQTNLFVPFYFRRKNYYYNDTSRLSTIFPLYWSYKNKTTSNKVIAPLIWRMKDSSYRSFTFAPLFSTGKSPDLKSNHLMLGSLYWQFKNHYVSNKVFVPLYWSRQRYFETDTAKFKTIFPLYWSFKNKHKSLKTIAPPLIWRVKKDDSKSFTFFPFYSGKNYVDSTRKYRMYGTLFWHFENNYSKSNLLFPVFFNRKRYFDADTSKFATLFPVYWSYKDMIKSSQVVFPIIWNIKTPRYRTFSFLPFYLKRTATDSTSKRLMIGTVYWQYNSPERKNRTFFPLYWNKKHYYPDDTTQFSAIFPLYWSYADKSVKNKVFFPLVWNINNNHYKSFTFIPFYSKGHSLISKDKHFMLASVYWQFDKESGKDRLIFPLYYQNWRYDRSDTTTFSSIFPLYWSIRNKKRQNTVVFPLSWSFKNRTRKTYTFFPLYSRGKRYDSDNGHLMLAALYWKFKTDKSKNTLLLPFYYQRLRYKNYDTTRFSTVFPLYWSYTNMIGKQKVFFPLIWTRKSKYYRSFTFVPLFSAGRSVAGSQKHLALTPLYWHIVNKDAKTNVLFPLYWSYKDSLENDKVLFPIVWSLKNKERKSFTFFPIYSQWSAIYGDKKANILYFLWRRKVVEERKTTHFIWPICKVVNDDKANYHSFRLAPIIWYKKTPEIKHFSFQPLYYMHQTSEYKSHHILWQLYVSQNYFGVKKSKRFLWRLFYKDVYENSDFETRFLHLVYANIKKRGVVEKSVFPFFHKREDSKGNKTLSVFFYFYNKFQRRLETSNDFYKESRIFWFIRLRSNYGQLKREGKL